MQKKQIKFAIKLPQKNTTKEEVELDVFTRKNLEITKTPQNKNEGSLLSSLDKTQTAQGGRKLYQILTNPINNIEKLDQRHDPINSL